MHKYFNRTVTAMTLALSLSTSLYSAELLDSNNPAPHAAVHAPAVAGTAADGGDEMPALQDNQAAAAAINAAVQNPDLTPEQMIARDHTKKRIEECAWVNQLECAQSILGTYYINEIFENTPPAEQDAIMDFVGRMGIFAMSEPVPPTYAAPFLRFCAGLTPQDRQDILDNYDPYNYQGVSTLFQVQGGSTRFAILEPFTIATPEQRAAWATEAQGLPCEERANFLWRKVFDHFTPTLNPEQRNLLYPFLQNKEYLIPALIARHHNLMGQDANSRNREIFFILNILSRHNFLDVTTQQIWPVIYQLFDFDGNTINLLDVLYPDERAALLHLMQQFHLFDGAADEYQRDLLIYEVRQIPEPERANLLHLMHQFNLFDGANADQKDPLIYEVRQIPEHERADLLHLMHQFNLFDGATAGQKPNLINAVREISEHERADLLHLMHQSNLFDGATAGQRFNLIHEVRRIPEPQRVNLLHLMQQFKLFDGATANQKYILIHEVREIPEPERTNLLQFIDQFNWFNGANAYQKPTLINEVRQIPEHQRVNLLHLIQQFNLFDGADAVQRFNLINVIREIPSGRYQEVITQEVAAQVQQVPTLLDKQRIIRQAVTTLRPLPPQP